MTCAHAVSNLITNDVQAALLRRRGNADIWDGLMAIRRQSTMPRVLLVLNEVGAGVGGIENVGRSLMRLLDARKCDGVLDYRVFSLRGPRTGADMAELYRLAGSRLTHFAGHRAAFALGVLWSMAAWADVVIFIHMGIASLLALLPRWLRPVAMTWIHGVEVWSRRGSRQRLGLARSDYVVSNTVYTGNRALEANPWLPTPRPCHLGVPRVDEEACVDITAKIAFRPRRSDILIVGRLVKGEGMKGHDRLIEVMPDVVRATSDARLIVVGTGDNLDFYRNLANEKGVADHVVFAGFLQDEELAELYRRCGVFAMPSRQEGFGLVYLEAMRAGLPCVASNCDAAQEIVVDGETGYLVNPDDRVALTSVLTRLLNDDALRRKLGDKGRARFLSQFTEEHFQMRFWKILQEAFSLGADARRN